MSRDKIGANREALKLMNKVFPRIEHHAGTANGASKKMHGGKNEFLRGTGQGNVFFRGSMKRCAICDI